MMDTFNTLAAHWDEILMAIGAIGVATESLLVALAVFVRVLKKASDWAYDLAGLTATQVDDSVFWRASLILGAVADWLDKAAAWVPRLRPSAKAKRPGPGLSTSALTGVVIGLMAVGMAGCGGTRMQKTRKAFELTTIGALASDDIATPYYRTARDRCLDDLAAEKTPTRAFFDGCIKRWNKAEDSISQLGFALLAGENILDGIDAKRGGNICDAIVPVGDALFTVTVAFRDLDIPIPTDVSIALPVIAGLAENYCDTKIGGQ